MKTWTMRDLGGLMDNLDGIIYSLQLGIEEGKRERIRACLKAIETIVGCMEECLERKDVREDRKR